MWRATIVLLMLVCLTGCPCLKPAAFRLEVVPAQINDSIPWQRCVLLATVEETVCPGGLDGPVHIEASAPKAVVSVENEDILPGQVAEITVIPESLEDSQKQYPDEGREIIAEIRATYDGVSRTIEVPVRITSEEEDLVGATAAEMRDLFIPWLAANHPELGITESTSWDGTIVTPHILIVTHYLFFSADWEMHVFWHVMIPPYDWARIELRHRFDETLPSLAFEIPSRSAEPSLTPVSIEPSDTLWR